MNVFEDLIVELKDENLLENTMIEAEEQEKTDIEPSRDVFGTGEGREIPESEPLVESTDASSDILNANGFEIELLGVTDDDHASAKQRKAKQSKEFFKKRAVDEVASHQMVEHVLTGVEREYMKVVPKTFDDFNAQKVLHIFLNIPETSSLDEHKTAESAVMQQTEAWGMALLDRDSHIAVSHIRQYCEHSRPALSSQAMVALARFYRNAPYSESVRAKFDFVMTRLFSRPVEQDKRACLFGRNEMLDHINTLYSEWSSIPLYTADSDESKVLLTGLSFEDLALEAERASHFDQLIERDFFGRLRIFKESISELFYAPIVTASAVESNIRIGNAYVNLIVLERRKMDSASIQLKYIEFNEQSVSDAAGRTLDLAELLNGLTDEVINAHEATADDAEASPAVETLNFDAPKSAVTTDKAGSSFGVRLIDNIRNINRWLIGVSLVLVLVSAGLYVWSTHIVDETVSTAGVVNVELDNSVLSEHIKTGRISGETFYGLLQPTWDALPKEKRQEYLKKLLQLGPEKGYKQVNLISKDGKTAGYASGTRIEVNMP